ncbi:hypothetical protein [Carnobacterium sp.]|uniref:hypothetical protein n=1 Tax=Carnobacterium sp. TaxID=48221 RepID=UPI00388FCCC0
MKLNAAEQVDEKINNEMKRQALYKTTSTLFLSFSSLLILLVIQLFMGDVKGVMDNILGFFIKGSLITVAISNIAGIISNLFFEKRIPSKKIHKTENEKLYSNLEFKEFQFLIGFIILLLTLGLMYSALVISGMNKIILIVHCILYAANIILIYNFNLFKEKISPEKYNDFVNEINNARDNVLSGKNLDEDEGVQL